MKVYSQLEKAQIENLTSDPTGSGLVTGRIWYRTDTKLFKVYDGSAVQTFVDLSTAQTLSNKILTTPTINTAAIFGQTTTPANPSAGFNKIYPKSDDKWYTLSSAGVEESLDPALKANVTLNNLGTTAINADLIPAANATQNLGSASKLWNDCFLTETKDSGGVISAVFTARQLRNGAGTAVLDWAGTNVDMLSKKIVGLAAGSAAGEAVRFEQAFLASSVQSFTASGTWTAPSNLKYALVYATASGGNGGAGGAASGTSASGGSGGAGETRIGIFTAGTLGASQTVTIGAVGANTTFGSLLTAVFGSNGGAASGSTPGSNGSGGTGGSGGFGIPGGDGAYGVASTGSGPNHAGVTGGASFWGGGGSGGAQGAVGAAGKAYGSGGGSGGGNSGSAGGAGKTGVVYVIEFT